MKYMLSLIILVLLSFDANSQTPQILINSLDSKGRKNGYWSEMSKDFRAERYYQHGVKNGIEKTYYRNGSLMAFLKFKNGHTIDKGYFFHEKGYLGYTIDYLGFTTYKNKKMQKGYFINYNSDGSIIEEGLGIFIEGDEELGEEIRRGKWKSYRNSKL